MDPTVRFRRCKRCGLSSRLAREFTGVLEAGDGQKWDVVCMEALHLLVDHQDGSSVDVSVNPAVRVNEVNSRGQLDHHV